MHIKAEQRRSPHLQRISFLIGMLRRARLRKNCKVERSDTKRTLCLLLAIFMVVSTNFNMMALAAVPAKRVAAIPPPAQPPHGVRKGPRSVKLFKPVLKFSTAPTDLELMTARVFPEPLIPMTTQPVPGENKALALALLAYKEKKPVGDISYLTKFLSAFPKSRWRAALELNLASIKFDTGYFTDALNYWQSAWDGSKGEQGLSQKQTADAALAQLVMLNSGLGNADKVQGYLDETAGRKLVGTPEEAIRQAKECLWTMRHRPDIAYKCGPYSLNAILDIGKPVTSRHPVIEKILSTPQGTNLAQLQKYAGQVGLKYQAVKRDPGAPWMVPAVVHWRLGHFAAMTGMQGGRYHVKDMTFGPQGGNLLLTPKALETETDGYFLVRAGALPRGWHPVSLAEAEKVWGKGASVAGRDYSQQGDYAPKNGDGNCPLMGWLSSPCLPCKRPLT